VYDNIVGAENLNPLDELKSLDQQVDQVTGLAGLKPIFFRLDEIAKANPDDLEVQLMVGDIKQHLVNRGTRLKGQMSDPGTPTAKLPPSPPPHVPPPIPAANPATPSGVGAPPPPLGTAPEALPPVSDEPTRKFTSRPAAPPAQPVSQPTAGPSSPPSPPAPPLFSETPRSPLEGPAPLSDLKPPVRLMSSGQFSSPAKPPAPPPPAPPPISTAPTPIQSAPVQKGPPPIPGPGSSGAAPLIPRPAPVIPNSQAPNPQAANPQAANPAEGSPSPLAKGPQTPLFVGAAGSHAGVPSGATSGTGSGAPPGVPPSPAPPSRGSGPPPGGAPPVNWKRPMLIGALLGALVAVALLAFLVDQARKRNHLHDQEKMAGEAVQVQIASTPANASIRVNGETKCNAPCTIALTPGSYQVMAFLDGYDPATTEVKVAAGQPAPAVTLTLGVQPQTVRILTDLDQGKIVFDDQPPADLQEGQFILEKVAPGSHTVKVSGKAGEATFTFDIAEA